jgi:hypothetical protein
MNLVSMGMNFFGPAIARKIAGMIGIDSPIVVKAISAALPAILAAVVGKGAKADGAGSILGLLSTARGASPDDFDKLLDGANIGEFAASGGNLLSQLVGGNEASSIAGAVGRHANIPGDSVQTLLGTMAPAIAGMLKGQVTENSLDASGLSDMLKSQATNIAKGMPEGFAQELAGTGIIDALGQQIPANVASEAAAQVTETVSAAKEQVEQAASSGGSGMMKWIILALIAAAAAWFFLGKGTPDVADIAGDSIMVGDVNISEQFGSVTESLTSTLSGITDAATAEAAVPQLEDVTQQVDGLGGLIGQLGDDQKGVFGAIVTTALEALRPIVDQALAAAGDDSPIKPIVDALLEKLTAMAG